MYSTELQFFCYLISLGCAPPIFFHWLTAFSHRVNFNKLGFTRYGSLKVIRNDTLETVNNCLWQLLVEIVCHNNSVDDIKSITFLNLVLDKYHTEPENYPKCMINID